MFIVRKATRDDMPQLSLLFNAYRIFCNQPPDVKACEAFLKERMEKDQSRILVVDEDSELLGFTQLYPIYSSVRLSNAWLLNDLFVDNKARQKGVATMLLNAAKQIGAETRAPWLLLQTAEDNHTAQRLYEKNGWMKETDFFYRHDL